MVTLVLFIELELVFYLLLKLLEHLVFHSNNTYVF